tara:strand:+ start:361 stop:486 length:126 start_codon:yes stop_codon:yes gene_type:complete
LSERALAILAKSYDYYLEQGDIPIVRAIWEIIKEIKDTDGV